MKFHNSYLNFYSNESFVYPTLSECPRKVLHVGTFLKAPLLYNFPSLSNTTVGICTDRTSMRNIITPKVR